MRSDDQQGEGHRGGRGHGGHSHDAEQREQPFPDLEFPTGRDLALDAAAQEQQSHLHEERGRGQADHRVQHEVGFGQQCAEREQAQRQQAAQGEPLAEHQPAGQPTRRGEPAQRLPEQRIAQDDHRDHGQQDRHDGQEPRQPRGERDRSWMPVEGGGGPVTPLAGMQRRPNAKAISDRVLRPPASPLPLVEQRLTDGGRVRDPGPVQASSALGAGRVAQQQGCRYPLGTVGAASPQHQGPLVRLPTPGCGGSQPWGRQGSDVLVAGARGRPPGNPSIHHPDVPRGNARARMHLPEPDQPSE